MTADREAMLRALVGATWCAPPTDEMWYAMRATMLEHPDEPDLWSTWVRTATEHLVAIEPLIAAREEAARREEREACIETIWSLPTLWTAQRNVIKRCVDAIRARGEP